ncbi:TetR/AcrR family transcriptional regulator [Fructobacillus tropaeoli]|uniref:AcrR family n=1 Tax=Fructobacillus tropaeoli TaxID=709323 RepID=A0A3F3H844_9LACO|nr:helix-turn-helix domain-containing protein [Fructobacillus tropaeoli]NLS38056.1 TetR family transcriptional regulator [Fructobacillus tropaeoli]CAK1229249.1 AcrR family [Fructobacillus tropaeoli]CAK1230555.1 AcrR family [Fructobacillus tropaeoli]CAK1232859.1 AcrR family [Fructobacillus tropaeoli]CAK1250675.1 AcrR family [Fructobacillus tropaeoli]
MGRNKKFDTVETIGQIQRVFIQKGYNATSLDDLVQATGLLRGSLYSTFGSKEGMFIAALSDSLEKESEESWHLILIAMIELTNQSKRVFEIINQWYHHQSYQAVTEKLGQIVLRESGITEVK